MALGTITKVDFYTVSNRRYRVVDIQLTTGANYTAGGETVSARSVGLNRIIGAQPLGPAMSSTPTAFQVGITYTSATAVKLVALGTNAAPGAAVADVDVTASTNLSTFTVRIKFEGY